jgi:dTMP kinase
MLITLEGIEGSGKTTQMAYLQEHLSGLGYRCIVTREPGGTPVGEQIRSILLDPAARGKTTAAELLLYVADRAEHIAAVIKPALEHGRVVLCDRFFDATLVYQGFARGIDRERIRRLHRMMCDDLYPDVTFLLDLAPEQGLSRAWKALAEGGRTAAETRFEEEALAFHRRVREGYLQMARTEPARFRVIDASQSVETVRRQIAMQMTAFLDHSKRMPMS